MIFPPPFRFVFIRLNSSSIHTHRPRRDLIWEAALSLLGHSSIHHTLPVRDQGMNSSWSGENPEGPGPFLCHKAVTSLSPPKWFGSLKDQLLYLLFFPINMFFPGVLLPGHQYLLSGWDLLHQDANTWHLFEPRGIHFEVKWRWKYAGLAKGNALQYASHVALFWDVPMVLVLAHVFMDCTQSGLQHKSLPPALSMMTTSGWRTTLQYAQLGTLVPANQHELLHHAALFDHTFVVMTSDRIITLWERPRRAFRAADHTREPE